MRISCFRFLFVKSAATRCLCPFFRPCSWPYMARVLQLCEQTWHTLSRSSVCGYSSSTLYRCARIWGRWCQCLFGWAPICVPLGSSGWCCSWRFRARCMALASTPIIAPNVKVARQQKRDNTLQHTTTIPFTAHNVKVVRERKRESEREGVCVRMRERERESERSSHSYTRKHIQMYGSFLEVRGCSIDGSFKCIGRGICMYIWDVCVYDVDGHRHIYDVLLVWGA